jgi:hypothetical protein
MFITAFTIACHQSTLSHPASQREPPIYATLLLRSPQKKNLHLFYMCYSATLTVATVI